MTGKLLLIWEEIPENTKLYAFDEGSELAKLAEGSAGKFINCDDLEEDDPIHALSEKLADAEEIGGRSGNIVQGPFSRVVICGFAM